MNTFLQEQCVTKVNILFDNHSERNVALLSGTKQTNNLEIINGNVYVNNVLQKTVHKDNTLYWEDNDGRCWTIKADNPMGPYRGIMMHKGNILRFTALPSTSYMLCHPWIGQNGNSENVRIRLEYGLSPSKGGGFFSFCKFGCMSGDKAELVITNLEDKEKKDEEIFDQYYASISVDTSCNILFKIDLSGIIPFLEEMGLDYGIATNYNLHTTPGFTEIVGKAMDDDGTEVDVKTEKRLTGTSESVCFSQNEKSVLMNNFIQSNMFALLKDDVAPMSVTELYSLSAPDPEKINDDYSSLLTSIFIYFGFDESYHYKPGNMDIPYSSWLGTTTKEAEFSKIKGILHFNDSEANNFLSKLKDSKELDIMESVDKFAKVSICNSFASSGVEKIIDAFDLGQLPPFKDKKTTISYKSNYYFNGYYSKKDKNMDSFIANPKMNNLQTLLMRELYTNRVQGLRKYLDSKEVTPESWAEKLYNHCVLNINNILLTTYATGGNKSLLKHLCTMLDLLCDKPKVPVDQKASNDKTEFLSYGSALYLYVMSFGTSQLADSLSITEDNVDECRTYLTMFFHQLAEDYFHNTEKLAPEIVNTIAEINQKYNLKTAEDMKTAYDAHMDEMIAILVKDFSKNPITTGLIKNPFAKSIYGELGVMAMYGLVFFMLLPTFTNWKNASDEERAFAVLGTVRIVVGVGCDVVRLAAIRTLSNPNSTIAQKKNAVQRLKYGGDDFNTIRDIYKSKNGSNNINIVDELENTARYRAKSDVDINLTTKSFRMANILLRSINIAIMGFAVYEMGKKLVMDIQNGEGALVITFDVLQEVCLGASLICEGVSLVLDCMGLACEVIPLVGVGFMIGSLVISMLEQLLVKPKEKDSPEVAFTKDVLSSFAVSLPYPDQKWIDEYILKKNKINKLLLAKALPVGC